MSDRWVVLLAAATAAGALAARPGPLWMVAAIVVAGLAWRAPAVVCLGVALTASVLGARALDGATPVSEGPVAGRMVLLGDPEELGGATRVPVRFDGHRYEAWAGGPLGWALARRAAGESMDVEARARRPPAGREAFFAQRHLVGRLDLRVVGPYSPGPPLVRAATRVRAALAEGAAPMGPARAALFTGLVVGDDRHEDPVVADDVNAAGLTHLLAVSGSNVAFVLALAGPLLRRLPVGVAVGCTLGLLAWFALLTRGEPSVLRAVVMAGIAAVAAAWGREAAGLRVLALAVIALLLLVDPLLVWSVGFQLSVAASGAIVAWARPLARLVPGPRWLAEPLGVVVAAQLGVAPVAIPLFGGLPVASLPANILVEPVVGIVTVWGLSGGVVAGLVGSGPAQVLHLPTTVALAWLQLVASTVGRLPLGQLRMVHVVVLAAALLVAARGGRTGRRAAAVAVVAVVVAAALAAGPVALDGAGLAGGARLWQVGSASGTAAVLVVDKPDAARLLGALRSAGVQRLDVVVLTSGTPAQVRAMAPVLGRYPPRLVLAPTATAGAAMVVPHLGDVVTVGSVTVEVVTVAPRLEVWVAARPP